MTETERNLIAIERYLSLGYRVFPVSPETKRPLTPNGFYNATLSLDQAKSWWEEWPFAAIAMPTGHVSGLFAYDIDPRNGGARSHELLTAQHGALPPTPNFLSGGGGTQHLFAYPPHKLPSRVGLRPGIDIKSDGGYIIVPFSRHKSGNYYTWNRGHDIEALPLSPPPAWLLDLIMMSNKPGWEGKETVHADELVFPEGTRENSLVSLVGTMNRRGMSEEAIVGAMLAENRAKCKPPLGDDEVKLIVAKQLAQYAPVPTAIPGVQEKTFEPLGWPPRATLEGITSPDAGRAEELVRALIGQGTVTVLAATWKSGKTLVTYRLILDVLLGRPVFGVFHTQRPLKVMMLQFEMPLPEDERRYRRLSLGAGIDPGEVQRLAEEGRLYHYSRPNIDLTNTKDLGAFHRLVFAGGFDLIVVDSVMAAFAGIDMNENPRVRKLYHDVFLPLTTNGISVLLLHHRRKAQQRHKGDPVDDPKSAMLGAQAWGAASDRIFGLEPLPVEEPGVQHLKLSLAGGWAPGAVEKVVLKLYDDGDATMIEPVRDEDLALIDKTERAATRLRGMVEATSPLAWRDVQAALRPEFTRNETAKGRDLAAQRGWVVYPKRAKATDPLFIARSTV